MVLDVVDVVVRVLIVDVPVIVVVDVIVVGGGVVVDVL
jgi:hypothetical protein